MKNKLEKIFENIHVSKEIDEKIMNNTIYKKNHNIFLKKSLITVSIVLVISITTISVVFAEEIKEFVKSFYVEKTIDLKKTDDMHMSVLILNNKKEINYDAEFDEYYPDSFNQKTTNFSTIEKEFNINILKTDKITNKKINISGITKEDGKISSATFTVFNAFNNNDKEYNKITYGFSFITKYYKEEKEVLLGAGRKSSEKNITIIHDDKLDTDIYFWTAPNISDDEIVAAVLTHFIYDDILYELTAYNTSRNNILNIINSLHY